jgi:hypothetical protein
MPAPLQLPRVAAATCAKLHMCICTEVSRLFARRQAGAPQPHLLQRKVVAEEQHGPAVHVLEHLRHISGRSKANLRDN